MAIELLFGGGGLGSDGEDEASGPRKIEKHNDCNFSLFLV